MNKHDLASLIRVITRHFDSISASYNLKDLEMCLLSCPSDITVLSIIQTYVCFGLEANAFRSSYQSIVSEKKSFIALLKRNEDECFVYVKSSTKNEVVYYDGNTWIEISSTEFQEIWTSIVIFASKTIQNEKYTSISSRHSYAPYVYLTSIVLVLLYMGTTDVEVITLLLDVIGVILCVGIIEIKESIITFFDKLCIAKTRFDCEKVDLGKHVDILSKTNLARLGLIYFHARIFAMVFAWSGISNIICITDAMAFGAFVVAVLSILYQVIVRQFCLLCLSVMCILIVDGIIAYNRFCPVFLLNTVWSYVVLSGLLGGVSMWIIEHTIKNKNELLSHRVNELKIKRSQGVIKYFFTSLQHIKDDNYCFCVGSQNAPITITTYISPWCSNCKKVALQIIRLMNIYPKYLNWRIYFDVINVEQFEIENNVQICLGRVLTSDMTDTEKLDVVKFWYKNQLERKLINQCKKLKSNAEYVKELLIKQIEVVKDEKQVPRVWINGRVFPENYSLDDLQFFIVELCMSYLKKQ